MVLFMENIILRNVVGIGDLECFGLELEIGVNLKKLGKIVL